MWEFLPLLFSLASGILLVLLYRLSIVSSNRASGLQEKKCPGQVTSPSSDTLGTSIVCKESDFPDNWWTGRDVFELEKRAIFSKTWLYVSHRSRFTKPGDYHSFEIAGFPIFLILGKDGIIRAFHNVCRHRAYTITKKESGSSIVLGCRYHGWSYNTRGDLIKAPHFDDVPGFDKSQNGLFEIHARTSRYGLIFINLDANPTVSEVDFGVSDAFASREGLAVKSTWVAGWTLEGGFNWKLAVKPGRFDMGSLQKQIPRSKFDSIISCITRKNAPRDAPSLEIFPVASLQAIQGTGLWYSLCFLPASESQTLVRCDLYAPNAKVGAMTKAVSKELVKLLRKRITEIEKEFVSCSQESSASNKRLSDTDENEKDTQYNILLHLKTHLKLEKTLGTEVFPTLRQSTTSNKYLRADILCKELDCLSKKSFATDHAPGLHSKQVLAW